MLGLRDLQAAFAGMMKGEDQPGLEAAVGEMPFLPRPGFVFTAIM